MKKILFISLLLFTVFLTFGQMIHHRNEDLPCLNKEFNIFVHAVYNEKYKTIEKEQIIKAIESTNKFFSPICVSFKLCEMDTVFNYNYNIIQSVNELKELSILYNHNNRINVYVMSGSIFSTYRFGSHLGSIDSLNNTAVFITKPERLPHELGHIFGLEDTYKGKGTELVDGSNCKTEGDKICDTPADPYVPYVEPSKYITNCIFTRKIKDANGDYYLPDVGNIMSQYIYCYCGFSKEQLKLMAENYLKVKNKHW